MTINEPENQEEQPEEQPLSPPSPKPESDEISLLDLLDGEVVTPPVEDDATLTDVFPAEPAPRKPAPPLPLTPDELKPQERPPVRDPDATEVQPRVAFSQTTKPQPPTAEPPAEPPIQEAPTQVHRPVRPSPPPDDAPTIMHRPVRRQPQREQDKPQQKQPVREQPQRERPSRQQPVRQAAQPQRPVGRQPVRTQTSRVIMPEQAKKGQPRPKTRRQQRRRGCLVRGLTVLLAVGIVGVMLITAGLAIGYNSIANDLPDPSNIEARASQFETAVILDRNGNTLYQLADPDTGNRTRVPLDEISIQLQNATIATEDSRFYDNPGFDPIGIARAILQAAREREFVSGASTITQQLVRAILLDEEERTERT
ncbi:MAG: transglycosylase domain-containing protein, partial [Anaerolineae bacterium]